MQKKTLFIILLGICAIVISSVVGLTLFGSKEAVSIPRTPEKAFEEVSIPQKPEGTLKEIIKKNIKQEFLPPTYEITDRSEYIPLEPSEDDINYYFVEWDTEEARFSALVTYNKTIPKDLAAYQILIFVKDPNLTAKKLGDKFLNYLPIEK